MLGVGVIAVLGLATGAAVMAWKRAQARAFFAAGGTLPEPSKTGPTGGWRPTYGQSVAVATPHPTLPGKSAYIVAAARLVRGLDPTRTVSGQPAPHWGIDLAAPIGAPVHAAKSGRVIRVEPISGYGNSVVIQHADDGRSTLYAHLNRTMVREGQSVTGGDIIGEVGRTTAGPDGVVPSWGQRMASHLHMEVHPTPVPVLTRMARRLDPVRWLQNEGIAQFERRS